MDAYVKESTVRVRVRVRDSDWSGLQTRRAMTCGGEM